MPSLTQQRCFNHLSREAVARCLECKRYFCRECVTEHDGRMLCARCLGLAVAPAARRSWSFVPLGRAVQLLLALMVAWLVFYAVGECLLKVPSEWHEGSVWERPWWQTK